MDDPLQTPRERIEKVRCDPEIKRKNHVKDSSKALSGSSSGPAVSGKESGQVLSFFDINAPFPTGKEAE